MEPSVLHKAIDPLPAGRWAVGVSGGADSVALLLLLRDRPDLFLHVVHLDHETRDGESAIDARFVAELCESLKLRCTVDCRSAVEAVMPALASNVANRFRLARLQLFRRVVASENLAGVILAHHADDQAETVLMRVLRGASVQNLGGMQRDTVLADLRIVRPLLEIPTTFLREFLRNRGQSWREDSSNASDQYQRNRVRHWLQDRPELRDAMIRLGRDSNALRHWLDCAAPVIGPTFAVSALSDLDPPLARHAGARWLIARGTPPTELNGRACDRLLEMATDAASPPAQQFPGGVLVRRRKGQIFAEPTPDNHGPILP